MTSPQAQAAEGKPKAGPRVYYFDYLRLWATVGVVVLHTSALVFTKYHKHDAAFLSKFTIADFGDSLGRFGVGCFFMVSGALLLAPEHSFRLGKQLTRVVVPLVVWSVIYAFFQAYFKTQHLPLINGSDTDPTHPTAVIKAFFSNPLFYHLWFVYVLVGIYLILPLLRPLTALSPERRGQLLRYALGLWLAFTLVIPAAQNIWPNQFHLYTYAYPAIPVSYVGTAVLGFYLHHHGITVRGRTIPPAALVVAGLVGMAAGALDIFYELTHRRGSAWALNNLTPQITLYAACVFLFAKTVYDRPGKAYPFVALFSRLSYRIYLAHALVLHYLRAISPLKHWYLANPLPSIPVLALLTLVITFGIAWLLDQIKPIRNYI